MKTHESYAMGARGNSSRGKPRAARPDRALSCREGGGKPLHFKMC